MADEAILEIWRRFDTISLLMLYRFDKIAERNGMWLSLVERSAGGREVGGSSPLIPTVSI